MEKGGKTRDSSKKKKNKEWKVNGTKTELQEEKCKEMTENVRISLNVCCSGFIRFCRAQKGNLGIVFPTFSSLLSVGRI